MRADRYTKVVLTIIAVALCVIALPRLETAEATAVSGKPEVAAATAEVGLPTPALQLRWRVMLAGHHDYDTTGWNECRTAISVMNTTGGNIDVAVEFFDHIGRSKGTGNVTVEPVNPMMVTTSGGVGFTLLLGIERSVATGNFHGGFALVHADDPRILVGAFLQCLDDLSAGGSQLQKIRSFTDIPAYPVGATAEFFQAGMPAQWTPPMAEPEIPE